MRRNTTMSNAKIQAPKGTYDIFPSGKPKDPWTVSANWHVIERIAREVAELYHYGEIRTPVFEHSELFHRGVGETSDIVSKETYSFPDRKGRSFTLRPEGTAGVVRAVIENGLLNDQGARAKVYYIAPNFRYEEPQRGRYRQHHQFGIEAFGVAEPEQDVECILLQMDFYRRCGVKDLSLRINSLGDGESKQRYRDELVKFLSPKKAALSDDSQRRLETNPLRILDSKDPRDIEACIGVPPASESLSEKSRKHFDRVQELLRLTPSPRRGEGGGEGRELPAPVAADSLDNLSPLTPTLSPPGRGSHGVPFTVDGTLVRGFDYYTDTLWEVTAGGLGAQNAIGGGGRYDNLVEQLGGRPTPGVGFGSGLERLLIALEMQKVTLPTTNKPLVWLISLGDAAKSHNLQLLHELRAAGLPADMDFACRGAKGQFKLAEREKATWAIVVGDDEIAKGQVMLKNFATREEAAVPQSEVIARIQ